MDKNMKILIVDDFSTMRRIIKNLLRDLGFTNTSEADDGTTALPMLQSGSFDFLVTDWNMPGMTGIELLPELPVEEIFFIVFLSYLTCVLHGLFSSLIPRGEVTS